MTNITVIDSVMGSGKTNYAIQYMNEASPLDRFVFVTPFKTEITRIRENVKDRNFLEPLHIDGGPKMTHLKQLIAIGADIATTHELFSRADDELIELLEQSGYTLILDEVMDIVSDVPIRKADIRRLIKNGDIVLNADTKQVEWTGDPNDDSRYRDIREWAQAGNLYIFRDNFMVWAFPPAVFSAFPRAYILTYLFKCQMQKYYFDIYGFEYDFKAVEKVGDRYELVEYDVRRENREQLRSLITVYEGKLNDVGNEKGALSQTKLRNYNADTLKKIRDNTSNFFRRYADNAKAADVYISTLKEVEPSLSPRGYKGCFIAHNARATNEYADRRAVAYLLNRYMNRNKLTFFQENGAKVKEELYAVSELVQWLFRSRIRNGVAIHAYIPAQRMRDVLEKWANYEI